MCRADYHMKRALALLMLASAVLIWRSSGKVEVPGRRPPRTLRGALVVVPPEVLPLDHALAAQQPFAKAALCALPVRQRAPLGENQPRPPPKLFTAEMADAAALGENHLLFAK